MFPWVDGFHWTPDHIIFLSLFVAVVLTIVVHIRCGGLAHGLRFPHPPRRRDVLAVELRGTAGSGTPLPAPTRRQSGAQNLRQRVRLPPLRPIRRVCGVAGKSSRPNVGVSFSNDLLYHRGHTWVRPENDGTLTVGLDEFAHHLIGHPDSVQLPVAG